MLLLILEGFYGMGKHIDTVSSSSLIILKKLDFLICIGLNIGIAAVKTSIASALLTLCGVYVWFSRCLWALIGGFYLTVVSDSDIDKYLSFRLGLHTCGSWQHYLPVPARGISMG